MASSVTLRRFNDTDVSIAIPWFADPDSDDFAGGTDMLEHELVRADEGVYVAELDGVPVAVVSTITARGPRALINPIVVAPESRGRGVGRAVLDALAALQEFEDHVLYADVDARNVASIRCFQAAGYQRDVRRSSSESVRLERPRRRRSRRTDNRQGMRGARIQTTLTIVRPSRIANSRSGETRPRRCGQRAHDARMTYAP